MKKILMNARRFFHTKLVLPQLLIVSVVSAELQAGVNGRPAPPSTLAITLNDADTEAIRIDGLLSEAAWQRLQPATNFRLNFLHRPGSDLFFVYNEQHGSESSIWDLEGRIAVLKMTYLQLF